MADLLSIGRSGVLAHQQLLQTTSNNIVNVNTEGYVRQRTLLYGDGLGMGVGQTVMERLLNDYAQRELRLDSASLGAAQSYQQQLVMADTLLSDAANSVSGAMTSTFNALNSLNDTPNSLSSRQLVLNEFANTISRFQGLSGNLALQQRNINGQMEDSLDDINSMLANVHELNKAVIQAPEQSDSYFSLLDERDRVIDQLSSQLDLRVMANNNGSVSLTLSSGQALVLDGSVAQLKLQQGDPDPSQTQVALQTGNQLTRLSEQQLGGALGGLFKARAALAPAQRELGQMAVAWADAFNQQNRLGMDLDNELGGDIFALAGSSGLPRADNTGSAQVAVGFIPGQGNQVTPFDYEVRFTGTDTFEVWMLNGENSEQVANGSLPPASFELEEHGLRLDFSGSPAAGDVLLLQPTRQVADGVSLVMNRPEDLALAAPLRLENSIQNFGNGNLRLEQVYNTGAGSAFNSSGLNGDAPAEVRINDNGDYEIFDGNDNLLGTAPAASNGQQLLAASGIYPDVEQAPGFEISIDGKAQPNDTFTIGFNTDVFSGNDNGLALAGLENQDLVRKGASNAADNKMTFFEANTAVVVGVGIKSRDAMIALEAGAAKLAQSQSRFDSVAGVNLEEEAADLIRFQQAYSASAQVVNTAKTIFDTLFSALR